MYVCVYLDMRSQITHPNHAILGPIIKELNTKRETNKKFKLPII